MLCSLRFKMADIWTDFHMLENHIHATIQNGFMLQLKMASFMKVIFKIFGGQRASWGPDSVDF